MSSPTRSLIHFGQNLQQKRFQEYAHGYLSGHFETKEIDPASIKDLPIALFTGKDDQFTTLDDARKLRNRLHD